MGCMGMFSKCHECKAKAAEITNLIEQETRFALKSDATRQKLIESKIRIQALERAQTSSNQREIDHIRNINDARDEITRVTHNTQNTVAESAALRIKLELLTAKSLDADRKAKQTAADTKVYNEQSNRLCKGLQTRLRDSNLANTQLSSDVNTMQLTIKVLSNEKVSALKSASDARCVVETLRLQMREKDRASKERVHELTAKVSKLEDINQKLCNTVVAEEKKSKTVGRKLISCRRAEVEHKREVNALKAQVTEEIGRANASEATHELVQGQLSESQRALESLSNTAKETKRRFKALVGHSKTVNNNKQQPKHDKKRRQQALGCKGSSNTSKSANNNRGEVKPAVVGKETNDMWNCPICTFENSPLLHKCEMCTGLRGAPPAHCNAELPDFASKGIILHKVLGDGECFFRAMAQGLAGDTPLNEQQELQMARLLRGNTLGRLVAKKDEDILENITHKEDIEQGSAKPFDEYVKGMSDRAYAGAGEILLLSDHLEKPIAIYAWDKVHDGLRLLDTYGLKYKNQPRICLFWQRGLVSEKGQHYDLILSGAPPPPAL